MHAADLATELQIPRIVIPEAPGLFSALGLLWADLRADFSTSVRRNLGTESAAALQKALEGLEADAYAWLAAEGVPSARQMLARSADLRYPLQNYEINVLLPAGRVDAAWMKRACEGFHQAHQRLYSHCDRGSLVQIVNLRISAIGRTERIRPRRIRSGPANPTQALKGERPVYFHEAGRYVPCAIYEREKLLAGSRIAGPAVVEQADSTIVVPPPYEAVVDPHGRLVLTRISRRGRSRSRQA